MNLDKTGYLPLNQVNTDLRKNVTKPITSFRGTEPIADDESQKVGAEQVKAYYGITTSDKKEDTDTVNQRATEFVNRLWDRMVNDGKISQEHINIVNNKCDTSFQKLPRKLQYIEQCLCDIAPEDVKLSAEERQTAEAFMKGSGFKNFNPSVSDYDLLSDFVCTKKEMDKGKEREYLENIDIYVTEFLNRSLFDDYGFDKKSFALQFEKIPQKSYSEIGDLLKGALGEYLMNYWLTPTDEDTKLAFVGKCLNFDYSKAPQRLSKLKELFGDKLPAGIHKFFFEEDSVFEAKLKDVKSKLQMSNIVSYSDENGNLQQRNLEKLNLALELDQNIEKIKELAILTTKDSNGKTIFRFDDKELPILTNCDVDKVKELAQITYKDADGNIKPYFDAFEIKKLIADNYDIEQIKKACKITVETSSDEGENNDVRPFEFNTLSKVLKSGVDLDFMSDMLQYSFEGYSGTATKENKIDYITQLYSKYPDKLDSVKAALFDFGVKHEDLDVIIQEYGDKLPKLSNNVKRAVAQYGIEKSKLKLAKEDDISSLAAGANNYGDDTYIRISDENGNVFKFDRTTMDLVTVSMPDKTINLRNGLETKASVTKESKIEITDEMRKMAKEDKYMEQTVNKFEKHAVPTRVEFYVYKATGEEISHQEMLESKDITAEYEIYSYDKNGRKSLIGLAETDENGGKHIEKHLTSLDGTVTDTVFASDKEGQTFMYYKITDSKGNVEYESTKKHKIIDDNHYITSEKLNGKEQSHDIQISNDKVTITKLDEQGNKTSEVVEFNIADFNDDTYNRVNSTILWAVDEEQLMKDIGKIIHDSGNKDYTVDRRLLPMLKKMSGKQWIRMKENNTKYLISGSNLKGNAVSVGGFIVFSEEQEDKLFTFLHESGHERFNAMDLAQDEEIKKIYEEEKALYTASFPDEMIAPIEYFLFANNIEELKGTRQEGRGRNEGVAETNALTETPQEWDMLQARTALWQQFFPRTIAAVARKLEECSK